jgi:hypothetical protein
LNVMSKFLLTLSVLCTLYFVLCTTARGQAVIQSPNYTIQMPNLNSGAGIPTSTNYSLNTTMGQTAPGLFSSAGYRVKSGFQYISSIIPFSFAVSAISVNFGSLTPQTPATASGTLTVSNGGAGGYQVKASENNPMKVAGTTSTIPNTNCDAGCTNSSAGVWDTVGKYGFGYNMTGDDVPADFTDLTYFRPFADRSVSESPQVVMSSIYVGRARQSTVTYKVNIDGSQPAGVYNTIMYTAIPSY